MERHRLIGVQLQADEPEVGTGTSKIPPSAGQRASSSGVKSVILSSSATSTCFEVSPQRNTLSLLAMVSTPVPRR